MIYTVRLHRKKQTKNPDTLTQKTEVIEGNCCGKVVVTVAVKGNFSTGVFKKTNNGG